MEMEEKKALLKRILQVELQNTIDMAGKLVVINKKL